MSNTALVSTKFYHFNQNNSGGSFDFDETAGITHNVIVEAIDYEHANMLAERIGLYFDGHRDCPCCGNRWYSQDSYSDAYNVPSIYGEPVGNVVTMRWMPGGKETIVHYMDGRREWFGVSIKGNKSRKAKK